MFNIFKLKFVALDISGKGYLSWTLGAEVHLDTMDLVDTINESNGLPCFRRVWDSKVITL